MLWAIQFSSLGVYRYRKILVIIPGLVQLHKGYLVSKQKIFDKEALF